MYNLILTGIFIFSFLPLSKQEATLANNVVLFVPDIIPEYSVANDIYVENAEQRKNEYKKKLQEAQLKAKKQFRPLRPIEPAPFQNQPINPKITEQIFAAAIEKDEQVKSRQDHRPIQKQQNMEDKLEKVEMQFEEQERLQLKQEKTYKVNDISESSVISPSGDIRKPQLKENNPNRPSKQQDTIIQQTIIQQKQRTEPKQTIQVPIEREAAPQPNIPLNNRQNNLPNTQKRQQSRQNTYKQLDFRQNRQKNDHQLQVNIKKQTEQQQNIIKDLQKIENEKRDEKKFENNPFTPKHIVIETIKQQPTTKNLRVPQQTKNRYDKLIFTLLLAFTAILVVFSYTPQQQQITKRSYNPNPDDEQISLK